MPSPAAGLTYTEVPGARDKEEFFEGLCNGQGRVAGESGGFPKLTRDVYLIAYELMREKSWTMLLSPLALAIPAFTFYNYFQERLFRPPLGGANWDQPEAQKRVRWITVPQPVLEEPI